MRAHKWRNLGTNSVARGNMMAVPFQHVVIMRFSYPALGGFTMSLGGLENAVKQLYDPDRLERRFYIFEKLTLPSLIAQSAQGYQLAVIVGEDMPHKFLSHIELLLKRLPNAMLFPLPSIQREVAHVIDLVRDRAKGFIATTRLDDDDAISIDCVEIIQKKCKFILETQVISLPAVIAFNNGLFLEKSIDGVSLYGVKQRTPLGIGLTLLTRAREKQTIYTRNHRQAAAYWNCISDATSPSFIRSVHRDNDSNAHSDGVRIDYTDDELREILEKRFGFSLDDLKSI